MKRWLEFKRNNVKVWRYTNVYPTAKIGNNVSIGGLSEIGNNVVIGHGTRIGAMSFIPEGLEIGNNVFIGPKFCGTNDKYPPSGKDSWKKTKIENLARIGAGVTVVCGIKIGAGALVAAGSVVTKSIPAGEVWAGVPAKKMEARNGN